MLRFNRCFGLVMLPALLLGPGCNRALGAEVTAVTGLLKVRINDPAGKPIAARVWVDDAAGNRLFRPTAPAGCTPYRGDRSFSCAGVFEMPVPAGGAVIHVEKGKEYRAIDRQVQVPANATLEVVLTPVRWVHMAAEGYYSADFHVHFGFDSPAVLQQLSQSDDLNVVPAFTHWVNGKEKPWPNSWGEGPLEIKVDAAHFVTRNN